LYHSVVVLFMSGSGRPDFRTRIDQLLRSWSDSLLRIVDMRLSVHGKENWKLEPGRAYLVMCSHASNYDIPATYMALPGSIRMLAKKELRHIPIFGKAMERAEFLFVDRQNREQAIRDLAHARKKMEDGIILWVAPEGTRSPDGKPGRLKKGGFHLAFDTDAVVIPVGFRQIARVQPARTFRWTLHQPVACHIGNPIDTRAFRNKDVQGLMVQVEAALLELTGQKTDHRAEPVVAEESSIGAAQA
jgi:1-acyl-sn-glycerol-3-phosphate acyltransferase